MFIYKTLFFTPMENKEIEIISKSEIRYIGRIETINQIEETLNLVEVRSFGTEDRDSLHFVSPSVNIYSSVLFKFMNLKYYKIDGTWLDISNIYTKNTVIKSMVPKTKKNNRYLEVTVPDDEYELCVEENRERMSENELKKSSKKYYDQSGGFYDNFLKK